MAMPGIPTIASVFFPAILLFPLALARMAAMKT